MKKLIPLLVIPIQLVAQIFIDFNNNDLEQWTGDTIVNNEFLGTENTFFWNGIDQYGQKSKIGRYIVLLEAYHQSAQPIIEKTTFVIGP